MLYNLALKVNNNTSKVKVVHITPEVCLEIDKALNTKEPTLDNFICTIKDVTLKATKSYHRKPLYSNHMIKLIKSANNWNKAVKVIWGRKHLVFTKSSLPVLAFHCSSWDEALEWTTHNRNSTRHLITKLAETEAIERLNRLNHNKTQHELTKRLFRLAKCKPHSALINSTVDHSNKISLDQNLILRNTEDFFKQQFALPPTRGYIHEKALAALATKFTEDLTNHKLLD